MTQPEWYERWFGEEYLRLYPHRDENEAKQAVDLVLERTGLEGSQPVLDLACGAGRHLEQLRARGCFAIGLDLSELLLARAREGGLLVVRGDMRQIPFVADAFGLVTSFFTSFGYFDEPCDDVASLAEVRRVLRKGGVFALDYLNPHWVRATLQDDPPRVFDGHVVIQDRMLVDGEKRVEKRITIQAPDGTTEEFQERVRLYDSQELIDLLAAQRLAAFQVFGDYHGSPLTSESPRTVLLTRAV